jgi:hypothetical protein
MSVPLQDAMENGAELNFKVTIDDGKIYSFRLTPAGNTLKGSFSGEQ